MNWLIYNLFCFFVPCMLVSHAGTEPLNVLDLKNRMHYSEKTNASRIGNNKCQFEVITNYNVKHSVDKEHEHNLRIIIPTNVEAGTRFDVKKDSLMIQCNYQLSSVWIWPSKERNNNMNGKVQVLAKDRKTITLGFDLVRITEYDKVVYKGERSFKM
ncbi:MAG TPA: hypothetical protein VD905_10585 [Flavobacteriales bacterium]|nr:hypothetical protein [Flavobacteriales bacterium]